MRIRSLEPIVCMVLIGVGVMALLTIGLAEETASTFLLNQERELGALDYQSLPRIYAIALIVLCAANIVLLRVKSRMANAPAPAAEFGGEQRERKKLVAFRTVGTAALLIAYSLAMPYISFFVSTALFLLLLFMLYGKTNLKISLPLSLAGALFFWAVFIKIAHLPIGSG